VERAKKDDSGLQEGYTEKLIQLNRTAKVVKGGRRFSFSALSVVGDKQGHVGYGFGKANDVTEAIRKSVEKAKRAMVTVPVKKGTLPHEVTGEYKATKVYLKPACPGSGVIAGGPVRGILECAGYTDIISNVLVRAQASMWCAQSSMASISCSMHRKWQRTAAKTLKDMWS